MPVDRAINHCAFVQIPLHPCSRPVDSRDDLVGVKVDIVLFAFDSRSRMNKIEVGGKPRLFSFKRHVL